jgi:hypothetical protein
MKGDTTARSDDDDQVRELVTLLAEPKKEAPRPAGSGASRIGVTVFKLASPQRRTNIIYTLGNRIIATVAGAQHCSLEGLAAAKPLRSRKRFKRELAHQCRPIAVKALD